jgi:integrase
MNEHRESPIRRVNPSGDVRWVARWTDKTGKRRTGFPPKVKGTFKLKRDAQKAIDACYELDANGPRREKTVRAFFETWLDDHPRGERTAATYRAAVVGVLDARVEGIPFGDFLMQDVRRSHAKRLVTVLLSDRGRALNGARNVIAVLRTMWEDALDDEYVSTANPFARLRIASNDPRVQTPRRQIRVWSWEEMHRFAAASAEFSEQAPAMIRLLSDCGLRMGEMLALERRHVHADTLEVRQTAWKRRVMDGTKTDHGEADAGRTAPLAPATAALLRALPPRIDSRFLFPYADGWVWNEDWWRARVWAPTVRASGLDPRPHEFRHSWVSLMRAAAINPVDVADAAGHSVDTANRHYTHALRLSFDAMRKAVGG